VTDELPPVPPDLEAELEAAASSVKGNPDASRKLEFLLDALIMRGQLPERFRKIVGRIVADRGPKIRLSMFSDKYEITGPDIDCEARLHLCGARCCSFDVALSEQDVLERNIPFVIERPYELPRDPVTKRCVCMDDDGMCTIYHQRPGTCRTYDCREDRRVWLDFEGRVPAPLPAFLRREPSAGDHEP
jgi:hypothetical protein